MAAQVKNPGLADYLQLLIRLNDEGHRCFRAAGDRLQDAELTALFYGCARRHRDFADELRRQSDSGSAAPGGLGSTSETVQRWWSGLRRRLATNETRTLLDVAERAEHEVRQVYEQALGAPAEAPVRDLLERQRHAVSDAYDQLRSIREGRLGRAA